MDCRVLGAVRNSPTRSWRLVEGDVKMSKLDEYSDLAAEMISADSERDDAFLAYENMYHVNWELPGMVKDLQWMRTIKSTDPHDAVAAGNRVLTPLNRIIRIHR